MTKNELILEVTESVKEKYKDMSERKVRLILEEAFESIIAATLSGEEVKIRGFANMRPNIKPPHRAYSKQCGGLKMSRPYASISFKMSRGWKEAFKQVLAEGKVSHGQVRLQETGEGFEDQDCC